MAKLHTSMQAVGSRKASKGSLASTEAKTSIWNKEIELRPSFGSKEKQGFFQLLGVLLSSGLGINEALEVILQQQRKRLHKQIVADIQAALNQGMSLSEALGRQDKYFNPFERFSVRMGERSGQLHAILADLAAHHEKRRKLQRKMVQAFSYPFVVILLAGGVLFFMVNYVVPMFRDIFKRFDAELPTITQAVLSLSDFVTAYRWHIFLGMLLTGLLVWRLRKLTAWKRFAGQFVLRMPLFGPIIKKVQLSRFCYSLGLMLRSKVNLDQALELLAQATPFFPLKSVLPRIQADVVEGKTLYEAVCAHSIFPPMVQQMVKVGERTARLDDMLEQVAKTYEDESEAAIGTLSSLLEPILIVVLGLMVGVILVSMYLPMFELSNTFGNP